jgi:hypothetical protein
LFYVIRELNLDDDPDTEYNYVIREKNTRRRVFVMNAERTKHNAYLVNDLIRIKGASDIHIHELANLDCMLIPTWSDPDTDYVTHETFFRFTDFASYLDMCRKETYPGWDLHTFTDYFFYTNHFCWMDKSMFAFGSHLRKISKPTGLVRRSFMDDQQSTEAVSTCTKITSYTHVTPDETSSVFAFNRFDTKHQPSCQIVVSGCDPQTLYEHTPVEFRKNIIIYLDDRLSCWNTKRFLRESTNGQEPLHPRPCQYYATVVIHKMTCNEYGEETRTSYETFISSSNHEGFGLNDPVVCMVSDRDTVYFECEIIEASILFQYVQYRYAPILSPVDNRGHNTICEIHRVNWHSSRAATRLHRMYFAIKRIQRHWRACISDPSYKLCKKRLLSEFEAFTQHV